MYDARLVRTQIPVTLMLDPWKRSGSIVVQRLGEHGRPVERADVPEMHVARPGVDVHAKLSIAADRRGKCLVSSVNKAGMQPEPVVGRSAQLSFSHTFEMRVWV